MAESMAEEVLEQKEGNPGSDPKFQRFAATVERALKGFELSREWQDLISCLTRLNKCLLAYVHFRVLPHKHLICRRLSQCLHPSLPGGVHLKVLDVYKVIFDRIGHDGLAQDLFLYSSGLFPLLEYGSMQVKPVLIDIYEQYYLPLGLALLPGLSGFLIALLPGLEEGSEYAEKVSALLDLLFSSTKPLAFIQALWSVLLSSTSLRLPALNYMLAQISKEGTDLCQALKQIDRSQNLAVPAICSSLLDANTLVLRSTLDLVIHLFPLQSVPVDQVHLTKVMISALQCLLKRDQSIIRRVFIWLLGKGTKQTNTESTDLAQSSYFLMHVKPHLLISLKKLLTVSSDASDKSGLLQPYRLLKIIYEQTEMLSILPEVLPDVLLCLKSQVMQHGGLPSLEYSVKKNGKRFQVRGELLYSANQFWVALDSSLLWGWVEEYLSVSLKKSYEESTHSLKERVDLVLFLFKVLPLVNMDGALCLYLPNVLLHLSVTLSQSLPQLKLESVQHSASFIVQSLSLLQHYMKRFYSTSSASSLLADTGSPSTERKSLDISASRNPFEESKTLTGLIVALLHQVQLIVQGFVSAHVCDMEGVSSAEMVTLAAKETLQYMDTNDCTKSCSSNDEEPELIKTLSTICSVLIESLSLLHGLHVVSLSEQSLTNSSSESSSLGWLHGLALVPLRSHNTHLLLSSLRILLKLWLMVTEWSKEGIIIEKSVHCVINVMSRKDLLQVYALSLWSLLSPECCHYHEEAADLISLLIYLSPPSVPIEGFLLETYSRNSVKPYQQFDVFWKYCLLKENVPESRLKRLILRMIEGLQSHNPAIYNCASTWLITTCHQNCLHFAVIPLYVLIREACPSKIKAHKETITLDDPPPHAKYCYTSLKETEEKPFASPYPTYYFPQVIDGPRYSYGLSLFLSVVSISPELITSELSISHNAIPDLTTRRSETDSPNEIDGPKSIRSLLEVILAECMEILSSDYPQWLDINHTVQLSLCDVKIASTALVTALLSSVVNHLITQKNDSARSLNIQTPSYIKGLLALCEVQKTTLIALLNLLGPFTEHVMATSPINDRTSGSECAVSPIQLSLVLHLFKCLYYQLIIDSMTPESSHSSTVEEPSILQYIPENSLSSQPMFHLLIQCVLTQNTNSYIQISFLVLLMSALPYFRTSLEVIASKVLKSLCRNLVNTIKEQCPNCVTLSSSVSYRQCTCHVQPQLIICYVKTLSSFIHYCLLPEASMQQPSLHYQISNLFWDIPQSLTTFQDASSSSTQLTPVLQEKRSFSLSWFFGGLFRSGSHDIDQFSMVSSCDSYRGVNTPAGQKVLWLLQQVYSTLTQIWRDTSCNGLRKELSQDISVLIKECLSHLVQGNNVLFYSSIAQTWMQWSQSGKTKKPVRDAFIDMLHTFKISSLEDILISAHATLINLKGDDDVQLSGERQKYLLHFMYRFISSPVQSSDELISCSGPIVTFLKDCHNVVTVGVEVGHYSNTPLLCMLTSILHVFVCRIPIPDLKTNKKQRRELQDIIYRLCDSLSQVALSQLLHSIESTNTKLSEQEPTGSSNTIASQKNNQSSIKDVESSEILLKSNSPANETNSSLEVQAMAVLSNVLSHFVDCVYENSEKDRVVSLLKIVFRSVWPSLHNYNLSLSGCYIHAVKLLSSLSGFQVTRKCWKDEVMELFINNKFFVMEPSSVKDWKIIIDNLMSQDKLMFRSLLVRIPSSSTTTAGMVNMFSSLEMERNQRAKLFKRMAFAILSGEKGQYGSFLQEMQEKLLDSVRWYSGPVLNAEVLVTFRVLLFKLSFDDLLSLWPAIISELTAALSELHSDLSLEISTPLKTSKEKLNWYYNACKILDTALSLPANMLPLFQTISWGYFGECSTEQRVGGIIGNILDSYKKESTNTLGMINDYVPPFHEVKSAVDLMPFLISLATKATSAGSCKLPIEHLENLMLLDFVEH